MEKRYQYKNSVRSLAILCMAAVGLSACATTHSQNRDAAGIACGATAGTATALALSAADVNPLIAIGAGLFAGVVSNFACREIADLLSEEEAEEVAEVRGEALSTYQDQVSSDIWQSDDGSKSASIAAQPSESYSQIKLDKDKDFSIAPDDIPDDAVCREVKTTVNTPENRLSDVGVFCLINDEFVRVGNQTTA